MLSASDLERFRSTGYLVLRGLVDADLLAAEVDRALVDSDLRGAALAHADIQFRYVPMMCERTPASLLLVDALAPLAAEVLGRPVLPLRAKAVRYVASAERHRDSTSIVRSVGFAAYLDPLTAYAGALRVVPGSHLPGRGADEQPEVALETVPGDVIVFDEHLLHGSSGGRNRRQWRVDFFADPSGDEEEAAVRAYVIATFPPDWDGGYDVDRFPSFGAHWRAQDRSWHPRLEELGVYRAAEAEEAYAGSRPGRR